MRRNGKKVTVTKKTITNPDGTTRTEVQEQINDRAGEPRITSYIENGHVGGNKISCSSVL
mgnify:FL=1